MFISKKELKKIHQELRELKCPHPVSKRMVRRVSIDLGGEVVYLKEQYREHCGLCNKEIKYHVDPIEVEIKALKARLKEVRE